MMDYELTEECYDILLDDFNEWSETYYQLFGIEGISGKDMSKNYQRLSKDEIPRIPEAQVI